MCTVGVSRHLYRADACRTDASDVGWGRAQEEYVLWEEVGATYRTEPLDFFFDDSRYKWQKWWDARLTTEYVTRYAYEDIRFKTKSEQLK